MSHLPHFDGAFASWCFLVCLVAVGVATVLAGWLNLRLGLAGLGVLILAALGLWIAPTLSQAQPTDPQAKGLDQLLAAAQARVDAAQLELSDWAASLQGRGEPYQQAAAAVHAASETQLTRGQALLGPTLDPPTSATPRVAHEKGGVYLAVSLSMPPETLRTLARNAHKAGVKVVIRGLVDGSFKTTMVRIAQVFDDHSRGGVAIDPQVFKAFGVTAVPTVIATTAPAQPCGSLGCTPVPPAFDKVSGNISLPAALQILSEEGENAPDAARAALARSRE